MEEVHDLLQQFKQNGKIIILASHSAADLEKACDVVYEMENGKLNGIRDMEKPKEEYVYRGKQKNELNEDEKNTVEYRMVMIDAQSGVALNPSDKSKNGHGNADYKGVLTWDDVQNR